LTREIETLPYAYDNVFDESSCNKGIYEQTIRSIIPSVFEDGKMASVFAYGQTGSGKTFTMMGCNVTGIHAGRNEDNRANYGLYYMAALDVFQLAELEEFSHMSIGISLFEIYGGKLFDLLNKRNQIRCLEDSRGKVCFPGLSEHPVTCAEEVMEVIEDGARKRSTGTTSKNADSSRSHAILQIHVRKTIGRKENIEHGRLTFIDLAGSERGADTDKANRATRLEGAEINTSLLALKEVIRALATGDSMAHIPFRGAKLTQVLKESFVGQNSCSVMIACIAPNLSNCEHTLNTLRYADRVKERNSEDGTLPASVISNNLVRSIKLSKRHLLDKENDNSIDTTSEKLLSEEEYEDSFTQSDNEDHESYDIIDHVESSPPINEENEREEEEEEKEERQIDFGNVMSPNAYYEAHAIDELLAKSPESGMVTSASRKVRNACDLVSTHRDCMAEMLTMCKEEMILANNADGDRDNIDFYLSELSQIHEGQCTMLATLHDKLTQFREMKTLVDDESFEDLRE